MNLLQAKQAVIEITARPDKALAIVRAINHRIRLYSSVLNSPRDLQESVEDINMLGTIFTLPLSTFPGFRKFSYIKPSNRGVYIEPIDPAKIFTKSASCQQEQRDRYYIAGEQVRLSLKQGSPSLFVGWYSYPSVLTLDTDTNWLMEADPYAVIEGAAAAIFKEIGDDASAQLHEGMYRTYSEVLMNSFGRS